MRMQCVHDQQPHADPIGSRKRRQDRVAKEHPAQSGPLGLSVDRESREEHGRDGVGGVAARPTREIGVLDCDC